MATAAAEVFPETVEVYVETLHRYIQAVGDASNT